MLRKIKRALETYQEKGWGGVHQLVKRVYRKKRGERNYQTWIDAHQITESDRRDFRQRIEEFSYKPLISVVLPVYNVEEKWLRKCLESVQRQIYPNWELCIADDFSSRPYIRKLLQEYAVKDARVKVVFRPQTGHISAASNSALELATGNFVAFLDHDDELSEDALYFVAQEIASHPETDLIYSDEDMIDEHGIRYEPKFKPDFSLDLFYSLNLITHLAVYRTDVLRTVGGFRVGFEGSQDYDLALRVIEEIPPGHIRHIPHILYHWRAIEGSVALKSEEKPYAHERARQAINEHLCRKNIKAQVARGFSQFHRVNYALPDDTFVTVISVGAIEREKIGFDRHELILIEQSSANSLNSAAAGASGNVLVFLESGIKPLSRDWLGEMVRHALQRETGAVGAKILYSNGTVHHGGIVFGVRGLLGFSHRCLSQDAAGNMYRLQLINNYSAVSGACFAVRKSVFEELGGFDAEGFPHGLYDADFCLRLGESGYRIVWTPYAVLLKDDETVAERIIKAMNSPEVKLFKRKWGQLIENDPFYNPNLTRTREDFSVELPPRLKQAAGPN